MSVTSIAIITPRKTIPIGISHFASSGGISSFTIYGVGGGSLGASDESGATVLAIGDGAGLGVSVAVAADGVGSGIGVGVGVGVGVVVEGGAGRGNLVVKAPTALQAPLVSALRARTFQ